MSNIMRYECSMAYGAPVMDEDPEYGEWVRFEDYENLRIELERIKSKEALETDDEP